MTKQHNRSTNYCLQTILAILILQTAAISCGTARETYKCRNFSYDVIVDEGTQFLQDVIIPSVYPQPIDQVERCTAPNLTEAVCPLFEEYSRLSVTLENLSENDSLHTNLSLLVLVTRKVLIDFCKLKSEEASCSEEQQCSLSSISKNCLYSHSAEELISKFDVSRLDLVRGDQYTTAYWIGQLISDGLPDDSILFDLFKKKDYNCTRVENSCVAVNCSFIFH